MKWFKRVTPPPLPTVPDDVEERRRLLERTTGELDTIKERTPIVKAVAEDAARHGRNNHYVLRLREAYGSRS